MGAGASSGTSAQGNWGGLCDCDCTDRADLATPRDARVSGCPHVNLVPHRPAFGPFNTHSNTLMAQPYRAAFSTATWGIPATGPIRPRPLTGLQVDIPGDEEQEAAVRVLMCTGALSCSPVRLRLRLEFTRVTHAHAYAYAHAHAHAFTHTHTRMPFARTNTRSHAWQCAGRRGSHTFAKQGSFAGKGRSESSGASGKSK
jgi:hypothetical protein